MSTTQSTLLKSDIPNFAQGVNSLGIFKSIALHPSAYMAAFKPALKNACNQKDLYLLKDFMLLDGKSCCRMPFMLSINLSTNYIFRVEAFIYLLFNEEKLIYIGSTTQRDRLGAADHRKRVYTSKIAVPVFDDNRFGYEYDLIRAFNPPENKQK